MTVEQILALDCGSLKPEIADFLMESDFGKLTAAEVIKNTPAELGLALKNLAGFLEKFPEEKRKLIQVANDLQSVLRQALGADTKPIEAPAPALPATVTLVTEKTIPEMNLRELVEQLAKDSGCWPEVETALGGKREYQAARAKSDKLAVLTAENKLDANATCEYITQLAKQGASALRTHKGQAIAAFEKALGLIEKIRKHPFTGQPASGPDPDLTKPNGGAFEWDLPIEQLEAIIWARESAHPLFPGTTLKDYFDEANLLIAGKPSKRLERIFDDYKQAKKDDEELRVSIFWTAEKPAGTDATTTGTAVPARNFPPVKNYNVYVQGGYSALAHQAIADVFTRDTFAVFLKRRFGKRLDCIVGQSAFDHQAFEVVECAGREGWLGDLIREIYLAHPGIPVVQKAAASVGII